MAALPQFPYTIICTKQNGNEVLLINNDREDQPSLCVHLKG